MIGTEFLEGQGLGNQLFCYVSTRCLALDNGYEFGTVNQEQFANNIHSNKGMYFLDIDLGDKIIDINAYEKYYEAEKKIYLPFSKHDRTNGCYIAGADEKLLNKLHDNTLIYGNLQSEKYFIKHKDEICKWLKIKTSYNDHRFTDDKLCILNMRGGEYVYAHELYLQKSYWEHAMKHMRNIHDDMRFMIITEDPKTAHMLFPEIEAQHLGMGEDYVAIHNARYVILSNSSFAFFPVFTSKTIKRVIAPKYWARHNVSDGFWASEQNIYSGWEYMDKCGNLSTSATCKIELDKYKKSHQLKEIQYVDKKRNLFNPNILFYKSKEFLWHMKIRKMRKRKIYE